jgi:hypothetical protein
MKFYAEYTAPRSAVLLLTERKSMNDDEPVGCDKSEWSGSWLMNYNW